MKRIVISMFVFTIGVLQFGQSFGSEETQTFFKDSFSGSRVDATKWNTDIATSGKRWCSSTVEAHHTNPGNWVDVSQESCNGYTETAPYGTVADNNEQVSLTSDWKRTFPYIWSGPPSRKSPFPSKGDFTLKVRAKYNSIQPHGVGISVLSWDDSSPVGNNPPAPANKDVFGIWGDSSGVRAALLNDPVFGSIPVSGDLYAFHDYRLELKNGKYSLFIDNALVAGPLTSSLRPTTIWLGNPVFTFWGVNDWTDFSVDSIQVDVPEDDD